MPIRAATNFGYGSLDQHDLQSVTKCKDLFYGLATKIKELGVGVVYYAIGKVLEMPFQQYITHPNPSKLQLQNEKLNKNKLLKIPSTQMRGHRICYGPFGWRTNAQSSSRAHKIPTS